ncbi:trypsin-like peptidase domain-containing protein [Pseudoroseomonas wenyumeiae]
MRLAPMMLAAAVAAAPLTAPLSAWAQATMTAPNVTPLEPRRRQPRRSPPRRASRPGAAAAAGGGECADQPDHRRSARRTPRCARDPQVPPGSPFEELFRDFLERQRPGQRPGQPPRRAQSQGSGFIIDASGIIVTNNHVVDGADEINVVLQDNTTLKAELVGVDARTDLAVLRVKTDKQLPTVPFGDSDKAEVGDWVLAIGNPLGFGGSVTSGIVSARGRNINAGPYDDFIQTDAAINRGNSGGPLFNMQER